MSTSLCLALALLTSASDATARSTAADDALAGARARWTEGAALMHVPGVAVVGVEGPAVRFIECIGVRRTATGAPVTPDTRFYIASVTKTFVATAAKVLEEKKKLQLTQPVRRLLPKLALADAQAAELISLEDLLSHRPGIECGPIVFRDAYTGQIDDATYFRLLGAVTPSGETTYTNVHFTLAGRALAAADGGTWQSVLEKRLFAPLKLTRTTASATELWGDADSAEPHVGTKDGNAAVPHKSDRTMHAAGGLGTTARDAARWLSFQLGDGTLDGVRVLSAEGLADVRRRRSTMREPNTITPWFQVDGFGLGWNVGTYRGELACAHAGGYAGAACMFVVLPERKVGAAVMLNRDSTSVGMLAVTDALDLLLGRELDLRTIERLRESAANVDWPVAPAPPENPARKPGALSLDAQAYVGRYASCEWGELEIAMEKGELALTLGDWKCALATAGKDAFQARESVVNVLPGRFVLDSKGAVTGVELRAMGDSLMLFERIPK